jgi:hypothetical protein
MEKVLEVPESPSFASNLSARSENKLLDRVVKLGIGFLLPPVIITVSSLYAYSEMKNRILLVCPVISFVSFFATLMMVQSAKEARNLRVQASKQMFYALYLMHLCAACYFFVGFCIMFLFQGEELLSKVNFALLAIEGGGIKYILGYFFLFITAKKLTVEYQTISSYLQVIQLTLAICGVSIFFTSLCYQSRWEHLDIAYHVPSVILNLGIVAGLFLTFLTILTFYASISEKFSVLLMTQVVTLICAVFFFMLTGMLYKSNNLFIQVIEENCDYLLKIIHKKLLTCEKYSKSNCGENLVAFAWDADGGEKCINTSCCFEITQEVVLSLQILMAWTLLSAVLLLFSWIAGQGLIRKIERFGRSSEKRFDLKAVACLVLIYLIVGTSWVAFLDTDVKLTQNSPRVKVLGAEKLDKALLPGDLCRFLQIEQEIPENYSKIRVFSKNGQVFPSEISGNKKKIQKELKKLKYCPEYISSVYEINIEFHENSL